MEIRTYKDLEVWKEARRLVREVYAISKEFPREELFGLTNQVRRALVSVPSNIAEACGRGTSQASVNLLYISRGSLYEVETQSIVACDLNYMGEDDLESLMGRVENCKRLLNGFIRYYESKATNN